MHHMKPPTHIRHPVSERGLLGRAVRFTTSLVVLSAAVSLQAQTIDNFDSGDDSAWQKSTTTNYPATFTLVSDVYGGNAYRLQASTPGTSAEGGQVNMARAVAVLTNQSYSTFYVAADLVSWNTNVYDTTNEAVVGLIARASSVTTPEQLQGVMLLTHYNQYDNGQRGTAQIYAILGGGSFLVPVCQGNFTVVRGHAYRMVFTGTNSVYTGKFYDLQDLTRPLLTLQGDDGYAPGYFPTSGYSGLIGIGYRGNGVNDTTADVTFDNFVASDRDPNPATQPGVAHGLVGLPQIMNRVPASYANFYPAASGLSFTATTLTATNTFNPASTRLFLNGVNVSSQLAFSGTSSNGTFSFSGLASNNVYDARIELQDSLGRNVTNSWTFDTFSDAYLASSAAKNIECEEYDFSGGSYFDSPTVSGYTINGGSGVSIGSPNTYAEQLGTATVDFFDYDSSAHNGDNEFRSADAVGTQNGSVEYQYAWQGGAPLWRGFDTLRAKYLAAQADGTLVECGVERTEGGEWLNYTRSFDAGKTYNVYLRHGCALTQTLSLDQIAAGPATNNLGTFSCVNALTRSNFRYAPLLDATGKLATVNLSGINLVRLTVAGPQIGATKQGLWLNYLAFVPAAPQVLSAAQANGNFAPELNQLVDTDSHRLTVPQSGGTRFYRVNATSAVKITGIALTGGNVVLSYQ